MALTFVAMENLFYDYNQAVDIPQVIIYINVRICCTDLSNILVTCVVGKGC
jgi:hypothetical protein